MLAFASIFPSTPHHKPLGPLTENTSAHKPEAKPKQLCLSLSKTRPGVVRLADRTVTLGHAGKENKTTPYFSSNDTCVIPGDENPVTNAGAKRGLALASPRPPAKRIKMDFDAKTEPLQSGDDVMFGDAHGEICEVERDAWSRSDPQNPLDDHKSELNDNVPAGAAMADITPSSSNIDRTIAPCSRINPMTLSASVTPAPTTIRPRGGVDVFSRECVLTWSEARVDAWEGRHSNTDAFYYRFVDPGEYQLNGAFTARDHRAFATRLDEWRALGYHVGSAWGVFSMGVLHRTGYQCRTHYHNLLKRGEFRDEAWVVMDGKPKHVGGRAGGVGGGITAPRLSERWETEEVKEVERRVEAWLTEVRGSLATSSSKTKKATITTTKTKPLATLTLTSLMRSPASRPIHAPLDDDRDFVFSQDGSVATSKPLATRTFTAAESPPVRSAPPDGDLGSCGVSVTTLKPIAARTLTAHFRSAALRSTRQASEDKDTNSVAVCVGSASPTRVVEPKESDKRVLEKVLAERVKWLREFMRIEREKETRGVASPAANRGWYRPYPSFITRKLPLNTQCAHQPDLSRFFTGVRTRRIEAPDDAISYEKLPREIMAGVHVVTPLEEQGKAGTVRGNVYIEIDDMRALGMETLVTAMERRLPCPGGGAGGESPRFEGVLVDPPWEMYVEDGRNDGQCTWSVGMVATLMRRLLPLLSNSFLFLWTHKLAQADVVRTMHSLGYRYVENLIWCKRRVNNAPLDRPSPYFRACKDILLIFKAGECEIRHQRSADVVVEFVRPRAEWVGEEFTEPKPKAVYETIERMLPDAGYDPNEGRGRFLELWAKCDSPRRSGWVAVHERKPPIIHGDDDAVAKPILTIENFTVEPVALSDDISRPVSTSDGMCHNDSPPLPYGLLLTCRNTMLVGAASFEALEGEELLVPRRRSLAKRFGVKNVEDVCAERVVRELRVLMGVKG